MNTDEFIDLSMNEKLKVVNNMLKLEDKDHLKNVSEKVGVPYTAFTKMMRDNGNYQYNQTSKRYEKLISIEEYEEYLQLEPNNDEKSNETFNFLKEHLNDLKELLIVHEHQLILDTKVYDPSCETINKSLQVNKDIYDQFTKLCNTQYPHLRQKDLVSQSLLNFVEKYSKDPY